MSQISLKNLSSHETKRKVLLKFLLVFFIFLGYFFFISQKYGVEQGFLATVLTWTFFVLCTPVADAGFLIDFPLRLTTGIKMFTAEIFGWGIAITLNLYALFLNPEIYTKTKILTLFKHILETPFPFWGIILISLIGTFVSVRFGDELLDKIKHNERKLYQKHKQKHRFIIMLFLFILALIFYDFLLKSLGINLSF